MPKGGKRNGAGRKAHSVNNPDLQLFDMFAAGWLREQGQNGFNLWANKNKTEAYRLISRRLPQTINADITVRKAVGLDI